MFIFVAAAVVAVANSFLSFHGFIDLRSIVCAMIVFNIVQAGLIRNDRAVKSGLISVAGLIIEPVNGS